MRAESFATGSALIVLAESSSVARTLYITGFILLRGHMSVCFSLAQTVLGAALARSQICREIRYDRH